MEWRVASPFALILPPLRPSSSYLQGGEAGRREGEGGGKAGGGRQNQPVTIDLSHPRILPPCFLLLAALLSSILEE